MQVTWFESLVKLHFTLPETDCIAVCSKSHSFGAGYGKFYTYQSTGFSLELTLFICSPFPWEVVDEPHGFAPLLRLSF